MEVELRQGWRFQLEETGGLQVSMEQRQVSQEKDLLLFWCERDAGVKQSGGVETGNVEAEGAAACTEVVCRSSQGWPEG